MVHSYSQAAYRRRGRLRACVNKLRQEATRYSWLRACAGMAKRLVAQAGETALSGSALVAGVSEPLFQERVTENARITAERIGLKHGKMHFLADSRGQTSSLQGVFCTTGSRRKLLFSADLGQTWQLFWAVADNRYQRIERLFVGSTAVIVRMSAPSEVVVLSLGGELMHRSTTGAYPWHGSQSISESASGVIMYAEYQAGDEGSEPLIHVWKSHPPYAQWHSVMAKTAGQYPRGDLRHFHCCAADPDRSGVWYVSSGDVKRHNRLWMSIDDGESWKELKPVCKRPELSLKVPERLLRFTSLQFKGEALMWATDDGLGVDRAAIVCCCPDYKEGIAELQVLDFLGENYARNLIQAKNGYWVICEAKNQAEQVDLWYLSLEGLTLKHIKKSNRLSRISPVTGSLGSGAFVGGVAFIPNLGVLCREKSGVIRLEMD